MIRISILFYLLVFPLLCIAQEPELLVQSGHNMPITCVDVTTDDRYVLTGSGDRLIKLWDLNTKSLIGDFVGHKRKVDEVIFHPNNKEFFSSGYDEGKDLFKWSIEKSAPIATLENELGYRNLSLTSDGSYLVMNCKEHVALVETSTFKVISTFEIKNIEAVSVGASTVYCAIWLSREQSEIVTLTIENGQLKFNGRETNNYAMDKVVFSPTHSFSYSYTEKKFNITNLKTFTTSSLFAPKNEQIGSFYPLDTTHMIVGTKGRNYHSKIYSVSNWGSSPLANENDWVGILHPMYQRTKYIASATDRNFFIRDWTDTNDVIEVGLDVDLIYHGQYLAERNEMIITTWNAFEGNSVVRWDLSKGKHSVIPVQSDEKMKLQYVMLSSEGEGIYGLDNNGAQHYYSLKNGSSEVRNGYSKATCMAVTNYKHSVIYGYDNGEIELYKSRLAERGYGHSSTSRNFKLSNSAVRQLQFADDFSTFTAAFADGNIALFNSRNMEKIWETNTHSMKSTGFIKAAMGVRDLLFVDSTYIIACGGNRISILNQETGAILHEINVEERTFACLSATSDGKILAAGNSRGEIYIYNIVSGKQIETLKGHVHGVRDVYFADKDNTLYSLALDAKMIMWDVNKKQERLTFVTSKGGDENLIWDKEGNYFGTKGVLQAVSYKIGTKVYPFAQFDLQYNRPDLICSNFDGYHEGTIEMYHKAYLKRINKMNIDPSMFDQSFHLPTVSIENQAKIPATSNTPEQTLKINAHDTKHELVQLNIWVNGVPIYGRNGVALSDKNTSNYETSLSIELSVGKNLIEVSVLNKAGVESLRDHITVTYNDETASKNLYFVGIGACRFKDASMNLDYADKDIRDVANLFAKSKAFDHVYIDTFMNEAVDIKLFDKVRAKLAKATVNDQVILMYSGHGVLDSELNYYLSSYKIDFTNPAKKGIPYELFDDLIDGIQPRQKLVLIDACHSGEIDKEEATIGAPPKLGVAARETGKGDLFKRIESKGNSFELMKELFADLRRGTGATVISSSSGKYFSYEDDQEKNGIYTYVLKKALNGKADINGDKKITVSELNTYVLKEVDDLTNGKQQPTIRQENISFDFRVH